MILLLPGCSSGPEGKLAGHIEAITEILDDGKSDPEDAIEEIHEYLRENTPEIFKLVGEALVALDEVSDDDEELEELLESWQEELEEPMEELQEAAEGFMMVAFTDEDAMEAVEEMAERYEEIGEMIEDLIEGGGSSGSSDYQRESISTEAQMNIRRLFDSSVSYYDSDHATMTGQILPPQFPQSIPLTPAEIPCGEPVEPDWDSWSAATWEALNFAISDPHYYSYQYDSAGEGTAATFTASAFGDLDCDGVISTFVRVGEATPGREVRGGAGLIEDNPLE